MINEAYEKALWILNKCATQHGFFAAYPGYDMVFGRDSMIMSLAVPLFNNEKLKETFKKSLMTLAENQSPKGQIPNAVDRYSNRKHHVDFMSIDSTLWFLIGHYAYRKKFGSSLFTKYRKNIELAFNWLACQDTGEDSMPEQLPTTDWQDAFPHRYGHTINTQALYYFVLKIYGKSREAEKLKEVVNLSRDFGLWDGDGFYLPWRWKNHGKYHEKGEWFDTLGNLLAIIFDLADKSKADRILSYIKRNKIDEPYPIKAIFPAIKPGSKDWHDYFLDCEARTPWHYLNGGIWTFIGGFYVLALIKMKKFDEAEKQLEKLAEANLKNNGNFAEWLNGKTGEVGKSQSGKESYQGWNAAMYIVAFESLKKKRVLIG